MGAVSATVWVEHELQMDTVTAVSGSGPASFFLFMEVLAAAAHERGLPRDVAHQLTLETAFGAAQMARQSTDSLATLREQVTSKGGTTAAASRCLTVPAFVLSSRTQWLRRIAVQPARRRIRRPLVY